MKKLITILLFCLTTTAFGQWSGVKPILGRQIDWSHPLSKGIVAFWLMNEGAGNQVYDLSGNGIDGTFSGSGLVWEPGKFGPSINGDAADYIDCGSPVILKGWTQCSVVSWIYIPGNSVTANDYAFDWWGGGLDIGYFGSNTSEDVTFVLKDDGQTSYVSRYIDAFVNNPGWHQMVGTLDGTTLRTYVDTIIGGVTAVWSGMIETTPTPNMMLCDAVDNIDHVYIYNRALSVSEIQQLYREPFSMFKDDLPVAMMYNYGAAAAPSGQVIIIQFGCIPIALLAACLLWLNRKKLAA
jgi:hypothetical protein